MSTNYEINCDERKRFNITFRNATSNLRGLKMSPDSLEAEMRKGNWLVLCFAIWDSRDRPIIDIASSIAKDNSNVFVAVRAFEETNEFASWAPGLMADVALDIEGKSIGGSVSVRISSNPNDHPMWLKFENGDLKEALFGGRTLDEVLRFIQSWRE